jgi:uncharacterized membrane protein/membrane-bound inhibitor of C-type lysozyme
MMICSRISALGANAAGATLLACVLVPDVLAQPKPAAQPSARAMSFACDGLDLIARTAPGGMEIQLPDRRIVLPPVTAESGDKYQEGDATFWRRGDKADVEIAGTSYTGCTLNAERSGWDDARLRGIEFRAVGRSPAWSVELDNDTTHELAVSLPDGRKVTVPTPQPAASGSRSTYRAQSHALVLTIDTAPCRDPATGEAFEEKASLALDGRSYSACGRWLQRGQHGY